MIIPISSAEPVYYIVGIITAAVTFIPLVFHKFMKLIRAIKSKFLYYEEMQSKIEKIFLEVTPNHGTSIKDKINKSFEQLAKNTELTEKIFYRQRWMLDNQDVAIFESDAEGKCVWANTAYLALVKRDLAFVLGDGWKNIVESNDRERVIHNWIASVKDGINAEDTYNIVDGEGKIIKVFCAACKTEKTGYIASIRLINSTDAIKYAIKDAAQLITTASEKASKDIEIAADTASKILTKHANEAIETLSKRAQIAAELLKTNAESLKKANNS